MNIENELSHIDELIRLEEDNLRTAVTSSKDLYGQDDIIESKFQELLDLIQEKRYVDCMKAKDIVKTLEERYSCTYILKLLNFIRNDCKIGSSTILLYIVKKETY